MKKDWTSDIKDKLSDRAETPPDDLWGAISSRLDSEAAAHEKTRRSAKKFSWIFVDFVRSKKVTHEKTRKSAKNNSCVFVDFVSDKARSRKWIYGAAAALIAFCIFALLRSRGDKNGAIQEPIIADSQTVEPIYEIVDGNEPEAVSSIVGQRHQPVVVAVEPVEETVEELAQHIAHYEDASCAEDESVSQIEYADDNFLAINDFDEPLEPAEKRRNAISLFASNTNFPRFDGEEAFDAGFSPEGIPIPVPRVLEASHKQPIRVGASVSFPLSRRFSLSTGVTYSLLKSEITYLSPTDPHLYTTDQTLHYIGVPVAMSIDAFTYRKTSVYLTAGAMAEKCVHGTARIHNSRATERVGERPLQLSLFAGAGAQINFSSHFSIYAEPLVTYYIDNHSGIVNIYKDRPLSFDLRLGLRYSFK